MKGLEIWEVVLGHVTSEGKRRITTEYSVLQELWVYENEEA
jgi:hypothetical protein